MPQRKYMQTIPSYVQSIDFLWMYAVLLTTMLHSINKTYVQTGKMIKKKYPSCIGIRKHAMTRITSQFFPTLNFWFVERTLTGTGKILWIMVSYAVFSFETILFIIGYIPALRPFNIVSSTAKRELCFCVWILFHFVTSNFKWVLFIVHFCNYFISNSGYFLTSSIELSLIMLNHGLFRSFFSIFFSSISSTSRLGITWLRRDRL